MTENFDGTVARLASELNEIGRGSRVNAYLSVLMVAEIFDTRMNAKLKKYNLNQTRLGALYYLVEGGGTMTPTDLSKKIFRSKQAITLAIDSLGRRGLVTREPVSGDRRSTMVRITEKGLNLVEETLGTTRQIFYSLMSCLHEQELKQLSATLKKLRKHLITLT